MLRSNRPFARRVDRQSGNALERVALPAGAALVFIEHIDPPTPLVVFGAGHDAMPVVRLAKDLGWHVTLVDHRPAYATAERFPEADRIVVGTPCGDTERVTLGLRHARARHDAQLPARPRAAGASAALAGALSRHARPAPAHRSDTRRSAEKGSSPTEDQLARLYAPVGLDIGSEGPTEVAMSILSEMQAVMTQHRGGHLRERKRPIHQP